MLFSEPKIPQLLATDIIDVVDESFSALQRAENSSMLREGERLAFEATVFQCSSASRKFLNRRAGVSDLRRAPVSVLFSEPKIPQSRQGRYLTEGGEVSVLFSEPKIPQSRIDAVQNSELESFSALQRAENSSIVDVRPAPDRRRGFSALQRAENSSIPTLAPASIHISDRDDHASSFLSLPGASP